MCIASQLKRIQITAALQSTITALTPHISQLSSINLLFDSDVDEKEMCQSFASLLPLATNLTHLEVMACSDQETNIDVAWTLPSAVDNVKVRHVPLIKSAPQLRTLVCDWISPRALYHILMNAPMIESIDVESGISSTVLNNLTSEEKQPFVGNPLQPIPLKTFKTDYSEEYMSPVIIPMIAACTQLTDLNISVIFPSWYLIISYVIVFFVVVLMNSLIIFYNRHAIINLLHSLPLLQTIDLSCCDIDGDTDNGVAFGTLDNDTLPDKIHLRHLTHITMFSSSQQLVQRLSVPSLRQYYVLQQSHTMVAAITTPNHC
jgi:hypothetical protein